MTDYNAILPVLQRMLQCGEPGSGIICGWDQPCTNSTTYLGEATIHLRARTEIDKLTDDPDWQEHVRHAALLAGAYMPADRWNREMVDLDCDIRVAVEVPSALLSPEDLALHRFRVLLVNNYDWGDGDGHEWALDTGQSLANDYSALLEAQFSETWELCDWEDQEWGPLARFLAALKKRPTHLGSTTESYGSAELPETPALAWVGEQGVVERLFPDATDAWGEIAQATAFCLDGLAENRPQGDPPLLYLNDLFSLKRDAALAGFVERVGSIPAVASFAERIRTADEPNAVLQELYTYAPTAGVWVI